MGLPTGREEDGRRRRTGDGWGTGGGVQTGEAREVCCRHVVEDYNFWCALLEERKY